MRGRVIDNKGYTMRWIAVSPSGGTRRAFATKREAVAFLARYNVKG